MSDTNGDMLKAALEYHRRGWCIIPIRPGTKRAACKWARYQTQRPNGRTLQRWFAGEQAYPAVILGDVSSGLVCRDFDAQVAYDLWARRHAELAGSLPTVRTARGRHVYFRSEWRGFVNTGDGELRGDSGHYCLLPPAVHPGGVPYEWLVPLPERDLPLVGPLTSGLAAAPSSGDVTEEDRGIQKEHSGNDGGLFGEEVLGQVSEAITQTMPTRRGERNATVFQFARKLKGIPALAGLAAEAMKPFVGQWHRAALPVIGTQPFVETWIDFLKGWPRVKWPANEEFLPMILKQAKANPMESYDEPRLNVLAAICRELDKVGGEGFYLATRTAGKLLGVSPMTVSRWLLLLEHDGWIVTVCKGGTTANPRKATRFRYLRPT